MRQLFLECKMGAAGDMLNAALFDICTGQQKQEYLEAMNRLSEHIQVKMESVTNSSISGTHMHVLVHTAEGAVEEGLHHEEHDHPHHDHHHEEHDHSHHDHHHEEHDHAHPHEHHSLADIDHLVESFPVSEQVKTHVKQYTGSWRQQNPKHTASLWRRFISTR